MPGFEALHMPAEYNKLGIHFQYPENWTLDENDALAGRASVTVYSPGGVFWSVTVHPRRADPGQLARAVVNAMQQEYKDVEVAETTETIAGREMIGFDLDFFYLDLIAAARVRCLQTDQATYTVFFQAEDREYDRLQAVFQAMTTSLLAHVKRLGS